MVLVEGGCGCPVESVCGSVSGIGVVEKGSSSGESKRQLLLVMSAEVVTSFSKLTNLFCSPLLTWNEWRQPEKPEV